MWLNFSLSNSRPKVILSFNVAFCIHACCGQYAIEPNYFLKKILLDNVTNPAIFFISPNTAWRNEDFPDPTEPTTQTNSPFFLI